MNKLLLIALIPLLGCAGISTPEGIARWQGQAQETAAKGKEIADTVTSTIDTIGAFAPVAIDTVFGILGTVLAPGGLIGQIVGMFN